MSPFENPQNDTRSAEASSSISMKPPISAPLSAESLMAIALAVVAFGFELVFFTMFMMGLTGAK